jgi:PAS domain S-box-containing protein
MPMATGYTLSGGRPLPSARVVRHVWHTPFLRNIFLACLIVAVSLPLLNGIYLKPAYHHMLAAIKVQHAQRIAAHLIHMLTLEEKPFSPGISGEIPVELISRMQNDLGLEKIGVVDPHGQVVFSSETTEIGQVNQQPYFSERVARGETVSIVVPRGGRSLETRVPDKDVVEIYVPVMKAGTFLGAFEVYYDITASVDTLAGLLRHSQIIMILVAAGMMVIVGVALGKAGTAMMAHEQADAALRSAHSQLEKHVEERTLDLILANQELQQENMERRQADEALRQSERRFRMLIETIPHGIVELDREGMITFVNPALARMYGYSETQLIGKHLFELAAGPDEQQKVRAHLADLMRNQPEPFPWYSKDLTRDGSSIETQVDWSYRRDDSGAITGLIAVISEITHRRFAEKALLDNLQFMNTLIDTIPNPVFYKDAQGVFVGCNAAYCQIVGKSKDRIIGRRLIDLEGVAFADKADYLHHQDMMQIQNPGIRTYEEYIHCADGQHRDYILFKATFRDAEGIVAGLVGIMLDITARKQVEKELKESKNLFDAFTQHIPGLAYMKDVDGRYLFVNDAFARFTGLKAEAQVGLSDDQVWEAETAQILTRNDEAIRLSQVAANLMETVRLPNRERRHLLTTRFPIFQDEQLFALGGVSIDVTESTRAEQQRQQLEMQLQQAQKMEALGTLAGGIAHDFNNILAAIIGYTEIVAAETPKGSQTHHYLSRVLEAGDRARTLVKQILTFSRQSEIEPKPVQVKVIVKEVLKLLRASLPVTIDIVQQIESDAAVMADPVQIHQVMMNLCTNAGYAMREKGGRLTVRLVETHLAEAAARQLGEVVPGRYLNLSVTDTGHGIAPEHLSRIFDPFFTTKPKGEGTGMGLSVVHGIVTGLGGAISVESAPDAGASFVVNLPVIEDQASAAAIETAALPVGTEKILVVDDEVFQTDMSKHLLGLLGYKVETCNRASEALTLFRNAPQKFDLVITDMVMPGMTGDELARQLLQLRPDLPIILCTGYSENITEAKAKELGIKGFALKPLVMEELARLIRKVLETEC